MDLLQALPGSILRNGPTAHTLQWTTFLRRRGPLLRNRSATTRTLSRRQNLPPDAEVIAAQNQPDLIVGKTALGEHLDKGRVVLMVSLRFDACPGLRAVAFDLESDRVHLVVPQPADADVLDADQLGEVLDFIHQ